MKGVPTWIIGLFVALVCLWVYTVASEPREQLFPSVNSKAYDGLGAFGALLEKEGYKVAVDRTPVSGRKNELVITTANQPQPSLGPTLVIDNLARLESKEALSSVSIQLIAGDNKTLEVSVPPSWDGASGGTPLVRAKGGVVFAALTSESGDPPVIEVASGFGLINAEISNYNNAEFYMRLVRALAPKGSTVVFDESSLAGQPTGLLAALHPGLAAAWQQLLLLFVVLIYSLGRRFGTPVRDRVRVQSTNQLLLAFGHLLRRGKAFGITQSILYRHLDANIRAKLNLPPGASDEQRNQYLTDEQLRTLNALMNATEKVPVALVQRALRIPSELARN